MFFQIGLETGVLSSQDKRKGYSNDVGLHRQSPDPRNEAIGTKFRHLVVKYQPNNIRALDYKQPHSHNTRQNRLQTPGAPTRLLGHLPGLPWNQPQCRAPPDSPLGDRTPPPIGPHPPRSTPLLKWIHPQSQKPVHVIGRGPSTGD
ncbi:hypothetical protein M9H77_28558 [Catharanthus roseus]|uniref:Uncharacterized protein n=1 Tax=Catharanthus roseus TaxID=4058 RepID=A0ACC0AHM3_CATRO|nr:hypothetical protein M9H77_28558 [Catharanthus roseus]